MSLARAGLKVSTKLDDEALWGRLVKAFSCPALTQKIESQEAGPPGQVTPLHNTVQAPAISSRPVPAAASSAPSETSSMGITCSLWNPMVVSFTALFLSFAGGTSRAARQETRGRRVKWHNPQPQYY
jgi:hypothetical protein